MLQTPGTVLLDTTRTDAENNERLLFTQPLRVHRADHVEEVPGVLSALDAEVAAGRYVAGYLAYEAGYAFLPVGDPPALDGPIAWFGVYEAPQLLTAADVEALLDDAGDVRVEAPTFGLDRAAYRRAVEAVRRYIYEGDAYQINFTAPVRFGVRGTSEALFAALRRRQRVAYAAFVQAETHQVVSASPELFFRRRGDRIVVRPMKGTIHRGRTTGEDAALAAELREDAKSRAENLMIVDLLRNDLSMVCRPGSVRVARLFETERYDTLIQMTSTVAGRLQPETSYRDLFRALFPCGSVTGAPKIRAMRIIRELEHTPRGAYCGAIGYIAPDERAVFNVAIRTAVLRGDHGVMGTGSGIVWDSEADAEYEECLLKARFLTTRSAGASRDASLIETMRWENGIALFDHHLDRVSDSADYFGYAFDPGAFRAAVDEACEAFEAGCPHRVRATVDAAGRVAVKTARLAGPPEEPVRLVLASEPVDPADPFFYHKTTRRDRYDDAHRCAVAAGYDEVLFLNPAGEVAEGSRSNMFVRTGERWATPPVSAGLLPGVYRRHLLATLPDVEERDLRPTDLAAADAVYVCNAIWGLRRAVLDVVVLDVAPADVQEPRLQTG